MKLNAFSLYKTKLNNSIFNCKDYKEYSHQANIKYVNFLAARSTESGDNQQNSICPTALPGRNFCTRKKCTAEDSKRLCSGTCNGRWTCTSANTTNLLCRRSSLEEIEMLNRFYNFLFLLSLKQTQWCRGRTKSMDMSIKIVCC